MDRSARITDLLEQAAQHEIRMAAIQDESNAVGTADIRQWRNDYQQWYAEALATISQDLIDAFRQQYEGRWHSPRIREFLNEPRKHSALYNSIEQRQGDTTSLSPWQYPFITTFQNPFNEQLSLLRQSRAIDSQLEYADNAKRISVQYTQDDPSIRIIEPRLMNRMMNNYVYRTLNSTLLASQPILHYEFRESNIGVGWHPSTQSADFLFRDIDGQFFLQQNHDESLTQHDSITPLRIDEAVNIFDSMPNQLMSFEEAFNEILSKSNITTISDPIPQISSPHKFKYDVAISYSGSDKHVARELSVLLNNSGVRVFFDEDEPQLIWGQDLAVFFESVYRDESKYCIIIVSKEYIERTWTNHERQAAISRAIANRGERYVLQVKLDESVLPGIPSTISYMSFKDHSPEQIAGIVVKILNADS